MSRKQIIRLVYNNWAKYITSMRFFIWIVRATEDGYKYQASKGV